MQWKHAHADEGFLLGDGLALPWLDIAQYDETVGWTGLDWTISTSTSLTMLELSWIASQKAPNAWNVLCMIVSSTCPSAYQPFLSVLPRRFGVRRLRLRLLL